jgi:misacylated tRNA(Ala) deacylase
MAVSTRGRGAPLTELIYMDTLDNAYVSALRARVVEVGPGFVLLDRSIFYPEGGGQPSDRGTLTLVDPATQATRQVEVTKIEKKHGVRHLVTGDLTGVTPGMQVVEEIDWARRYDHMRHHTSQHLVSALALELFGAKTVGNQLYRDRARIDLFPWKPTDADLQHLLQQCNARMDSGRSVRAREVDRSELENGPVAARANLNLVPPMLQRLRVIEIEGTDICPCAGTHVRDTRELGNVGSTKLDNKGKDRVRLEYTLTPAKGPAPEARREA